VYRGFNAFCTACGAPRIPLANASVNLAGQPSKVGGTITRVVGWVVLVLGTLLAAGTFAACSSIVGAATAAPFVLSVPIAIVTWVLSYFILKGGKQLEQSGADLQKATRTQAVFALANTRGGLVTPADLARSIGITVKEADDHLTAMAKESPDHVTIDVDDNGTIYYRFSAAHWAAIAPNAPAALWSRGGHMAPNVGPAVHQRVAPPPVRVADAAAPNVRVEPREAQEVIADELEPEPVIADGLEPEPGKAQRHAR
jgi:hypothetical protein